MGELIYLNHSGNHNPSFVTFGREFFGTNGLLGFRKAKNKLLKMAKIQRQQGKSFFL